MGALSFFRNVYDLDTLDTRFTVTSTTPYQTVIESRNDTAFASKERAARWKSRPPSESRWKTPEFYVYLVGTALAIPAMLWVAYEASQRTT